MKQHPILFNTAMVRAILDGRKTQTRRKIGHQPTSDKDVHIGLFHPKVIDSEGFYRAGNAVLGAYSTDGEWLGKSPYGEIGDQLWIRETWAEAGTMDPSLFIYRADYPNCVPTEYENIPPANEITWKPSIHMPSEASRITLEITNLRIERLQNISEQDAIQEGTIGGHGAIPNYQYSATPLEHFKHIWESTGGDWNTNPWVWVIEFKRVAA